MKYKIEVVLEDNVDQVEAGYIASKIMKHWGSVDYAKVCASENKVENCHITQQLKAEIAVDLLRGIMARTLFSAESQGNIVSEFQRQLSAV